MITWADSVESGGVTERPFRVLTPAGLVPGILWSPSSLNARRPLVLLGHGGSGHKRNPRTVELATWFAREARLPTAAIDGPHHGDRATLPDYRTRAQTEGMPAVLDHMTADWLATVDTLTPYADTNTLAYIGMSMGARFGIPTAAALALRLKAVVLGKFGLHAAPPELQAIDTPARISADASRVTAPTLFHVQWHDEIFPREGQLTLFDHFASPEKQLTAHPGPHATTPLTALAHWRSFVLEHLLG